jgi:demethylmenaquinone methyltransferase/2-methoxy-6-polyprenyl-1,4-benzoquinol methylase
MSNAIPPHPPLSDYYGDASKRERFVRDIFDETAEWYDAIISMLSFGSGNRYRRDALVRAGVKSGADVLDLATGTGVVARAASLLGAEVIGADASIGMLRAGKSRAPKVQAKGESLPFRSASFDFLTIGYALRHFADLRTLFVECRRVLRPGGTILVLEITPPRSRVGYAALRFHLNRVVPTLARLRSGSTAAKKLMHYYWDTIDACVPPDTILAALGDAGFGDAKRHVELGTFSEYTANSAPSGAPASAGEGAGTRPAKAGEGARTRPAKAGEGAGTRPAKAGEGTGTRPAKAGAPL